MSVSSSGTIFGRDVFSLLSTGLARCRLVLKNSSFLGLGRVCDFVQDSDLAPLAALLLLSNLGRDTGEASSCCWQTSRSSAMERLQAEQSSSVTWLEHSS